jgi:hypothetical protein
MYIHSRVVTIAPGRLRDSNTFVANVTSLMNQRTGADFAVYSFVYGRPAGSLFWTTTLPTQGAGIDIGDRLLADAAYVALLDGAGSMFTGPPVDSLRQIVHVAGEVTAPAPFIVGTLANCEGPRIGDAMAWGVQMTDIVHRATGAAVVFTADVYGPFGGVAWFTGLPDITAVDVANDALQQSAEYSAALSESTGMFETGSSRSALVRRLF